MDQTGRLPPGLRPFVQGMPLGGAPTMPGPIGAMDATAVLDGQGAAPSPADALAGPGAAAPGAGAPAGAAVPMQPPAIAPPAPMPAAMPGPIPGAPPMPAAAAGPGLDPRALAMALIRGR
jgi:hypothetical protein